MLNTKKGLVATLLASLQLVSAGTLPFSFGNTTNDIFTPPSDDAASAVLDLPIPMTYKGKSIRAASQVTNGYINFGVDASAALFGSSSGSVDAFYVDIDTRNGGEGQNELWFRVGTNATDLTLAKNIIAGTGKSFSPEVVIVGTWNKVEAFERNAGPQNTFQVVVAYDESGTTWAIFAYAQLEFYSPSIGDKTNVGFVTSSRNSPDQTLFIVNSNATMNELLTGTNCDIPGVYAFKVIQTCGLFGLSIICPFTFCGFFGRLLGLCGP